MTPTTEPLTPLATGVPDASGYTLLPDGRVLHPDGYPVDAATVRLANSATPDNTTRGRVSRMAAFVQWCGERGRLHTDAGAVADYAAHLVALRHPAETIATYLSTIVGQLAASQPPVLVPASALTMARDIISARAHQEAQDDDGQGDVLQASECSREELLAMLDTLDTTTVAGLRDALALVLAWHMAARASEPGTLRIRDAEEIAVQFPGENGAEPVAVAGLLLTLRLSKQNAHGLTTETIQLLESGDAACPVALYRAWAAVLAEQGITSGPLLRRVRNGKCTSAGRPPADPARAGGFGDRALRNLIARCAHVARLVEPLTAEQVELMSTKAERERLADLESAAERDALRTQLRLERRKLRRSRPRYSGHSMRRGRVQDYQQRGTPAHVIERLCRYARGSRALARYLDPLIAWAEHPDRPGRPTYPTGPRVIRSRP
ncbi:hypothetical protein ACWC9H_27230 [Streptomyces sp. NPDC001251]